MYVFLFLSNYDRMVSCRSNCQDECFDYSQKKILTKNMFLKKYMFLECVLKRNETKSFDHQRFIQIN